MIQVVRIKTDNPQGSYEETFPYCIDYDPLTNDAQAMELLKWLINSSMYGVNAIKIKDKITLIVDEYRLEGDTLNEAIIKAVVAMEDTNE